MPLYTGDRVRIDTWTDSSFHDMRGTVVACAIPARVLVQLDEDVAPTLFFPGEVQPLEHG